VPWERPYDRIRRVEMAKTVIWTKEAEIGTLTLNRPKKLNALNRKVFADLRKSLESMEKDRDIKVLILTGSGGGFCAGGDLEDHPAFVEEDPSVRDAFIREGQQITRLLRSTPKPVIAAVNGVAAGAGLDIAMACDMRIASEDATFAMSFVRAGAMPDLGGTYFLPRLVGLGKALEMILTGDVIDAREAYRIGLVNQVVSSSELMPRAKALGGRLARGSTDAYRLIKWAVYRGLERNLESALENESYGQNFLLGTEQVRAFAKRFAGRKKMACGR
jgi:2-(1,2-epoxy-1,2-dihydrophenyl)acetyl-CoA isomerase